VRELAWELVRLEWGEEGRTPQRHERAFDSVRDAEMYVETQVALQRGKGYVEQTATAEEPDVPLRTARLETPDGARGCAVEIVVQRDLEVTIRRGTRERDTDNLPAEAIATRFERRRDTIAYFDRYVDDRVYDGAELVQRHADLTQTHAALEAACRAAPDDPMPCGPPTPTG
jgi:predicted DNA-binding WGR domain protein